ncbi:MAG: glycosyltransferase family 39 protein [Vicinamibacteria bacterium]|nr:glycosyltransferase family 39 protein [Vicinamibacteria bacterium]
MWAIIAVGLFFRLRGLGRENLWLDEVVSVEWIRLPFLAMLRAIADDVHAPLYFILLRLWCGLCGASEFSVRALSAVFGLLSLVAVESLGRRLYGVGVGLSAAALLAVCPYHIYYSQEARPYALLVLLSVLNFHALSAAVQTPSSRATIGYVVTGVLLAYTHSHAAFVLVAQIVYGAALTAAETKRDNTLWRTMRLQLPVWLLLIPWAPFLLAQASRVNALFWVTQPKLDHLIAAWIQYSGSLTSFAIVIVLLTAEFAWTLLAWRRGSGKGSIGSGILVAWWFVPQLIPFGISRLLRPMYLARTSIAVLPALHLLVARAAWRLSPLARSLPGLPGLPRFPGLEPQKPQWEYLFP